MRIVQFTEANNRLRELLDQVASDADVAVIVRSDASDAVVMSYDHYSSLMETLHLLGSPANTAHLARSIEEVHIGKAQVRQLIDSPEQEDNGDAQHSILK